MVLKRQGKKRARSLTAWKLSLAWYKKTLVVDASHRCSSPNTIPGTKYTGTVALVRVIGPLPARRVSIERKRDPGRGREASLGVKES
jgi:hypothetical protein